MSESWHFNCLKCEEKNTDGINHGDKILLNVLRHVDAIKILLDNDESGYIEISIMGIGTEPIYFLKKHYGEGHDVVVYSEYGNIKRVEKRDVMIVVTDKIRIQKALKHANQVLDICQQKRGNFVINAVIKRDIDAVEQGDHSEIAIKRLEDMKY